MLALGEARQTMRAGFAKCQQLEHSDADKDESRAEWRSWAKRVVGACVKKVEGASYSDGSDIAFLSGDELVEALDNLDWLEAAAIVAFVTQAPRPEQLD